MKKIYLMIAAMFASSSLLAENPSGAPKIEPLPAEVQQALVDAGILQPVNSRSVNGLREVSLPSTGRNAAPKQVAPKAVSETSWTDLGNASFTHSFLSSLGVSDCTETIDAKAQQGASGSYIRIVEPFANMTNTKNVTYMQSIEGSSFYFNVSDPTKVKLEGDEVVVSCIGKAASYGNIKFKDLYTFYVDNGYSAYLTSDSYGSYVDGAITFPEGTLLVNLSGVGTSYYKVIGDFKFVLPGGKDYNVSIDIDNNCVTSDFNVTFNLSSDIAYAKAVFFNGYCPGWAELYTSIDNGEYSSNKITETTPLNVNLTTLGVTAHTYFSFFLLGYSADDTLVVKKSARVFVQPDESDSWVSIGKGKYTDGFYVGTYDNITAQEVEVEIEENKNAAGYFRVVDPFEALYPNYIHDKTHKHYLYVDATDETCVYVEASASGIDMGYGMGCIDSVVYEYAGSGYNLTEYYGTWDKETNEITLPAKAVYLGEENYKEGYLYTANADTTFSLKLPESYGAGVKSITVDDNAPVEYFNLQGVRIANPEAGQLVIRRQGSNVTKTVVR
jgi:hypothetical protein